LGGKFFAELAKKPVFGTKGSYTLNHLTFVLLSMLSTSYIAHYNDPKFYSELRNNSMSRFNTVVGGAFGSAIIFFIFIMSMGFLTFGGATEGFVLNNYASKDVIATVARFAIGLALLTGYPFTFSALREGVMDIRGLTGIDRDSAAGTTTITLLALVTGLALLLKNVGFVVSMTGALFGCTLMFVVSALMNINTMKTVANRMAGALTDGDNMEITLNYGMIGTGLVMAVIGIAVSVLDQMGKLK